jgi:hypothetical protein
MDRLKTILERDQDFTLSNLFQPTLPKKALFSLTVKQYISLIRDTYFKDIIDAEFKQYIEYYVLNTAENTENLS